MEKMENEPGQSTAAKTMQPVIIEMSPISREVPG